MDRQRAWDHFKVVGRSPAFRLVAYFVVLAAVISAIATLVPWFRQLLLPTATDSAGFGDLEPPLSQPFEGQPFPDAVLGTAVLGLLSLVGALVFTVPVVWIYTVIMRQEGYEKAFVRMLAALPIVVAGVVQVVRGDLALAFALAGIVAAVRFRTTVRDLHNAVFAFAAIAIGLASGTGNFTLAGAIATFFALLSYFLWRFNVGAVEPSLELSHGGVPLAEALAPGDPMQAVVVGDESAVSPVDVDDLPGLSEAIDRLADYVRADALRKKKKYNTLLLAYTDSPAAAEDKVEEVLEEHSSRWVEVDRIELNGSGIVAVEYLLRLKKDVDVGRMIDRLSCGENAAIRAAELKPIKGLRKRLT